MTDCSGWLKFGFNEVNGLVLKQACFAVFVTVPCVNGDAPYFGKP